jgi:lipopolysaccharide biosynthesis glycosyltransferase
MPVDYLPVMLSVDHPHPEIEAWVAARFAALNKKKVLVVGRADLPKEALLGHPTYAKAWLWDVVPEDVQRILFLDFDVVPLRPLPEIPDASFVAVPDAQWYVDRMRSMYPFIAKTRHVFNAGFFVAHRDTRRCFDQLKSFLVTLGYENPYGTAYEQTLLNFLIQSSFDVHWLPHTFHCLAHSNYTEVPDAYLWHLTGVPGEARWVTMRLLQSILGIQPIQDRR